MFITLSIWLFVIVAYPDTCIALPLTKSGALIVLFVIVKLNPRAVYLIAIAGLLLELMDTVRAEPTTFVNVLFVMF